MTNNNIFLETEENYRNLMQDKLHELCSATGDSIILLDKDLKSIGLNFDFPNSGITINNKINEISNRFKKASISMYIKEGESLENPEETVLNPSTIGTAIFADLLSYSNVAAIELQKCSMLVANINNRKKEKETALATLTPFQKFIFSIRSKFVSNKSSKPYSSEELSKINSCLSRYADCNSNIEHYSLENNIISSLTKYLNASKYPIINIPDLLAKDIIPDFEALGLSDLIPELENSLVNQINAKNFVIKRKINHEKAKEAAEANINQDKNLLEKDDRNDI